MPNLTCDGEWKCTSIDQGKEDWIFEERGFKTFIPDFPLTPWTCTGTGKLVGLSFSTVLLSLASFPFLHEKDNEIYKCFQATGLFLEANLTMHFTTGRVWWGEADRSSIWLLKGVTVVLCPTTACPAFVWPFVLKCFVFFGSFNTQWWLMILLLLLFTTLAAIASVTIPGGFVLSYYCYYYCF